jgi:hypothetical protein
MILVSVPAGAQESGGGPAEKEDEELMEVEDVDSVPSAREAVDKVRESARERVSQALKVWRRALVSLTARKITAWVVFAVLVLFGAALLFAGYRLINSTFVFVSTAVGTGVGAYLGLQACVVASPQGDATGKAVCLLLGAVFGIALFLGSAVRARPVAWMLVTAAPFLALSASVFPSSPTLAIVAAVGGLGMGLATALRQRPVTTVSSAMLGAMALLFSAGMFVYLLDNPALHGWFDTAVGHPLVLALGLVLLIFVGTDIQLILSRGGDS